MLIRRSWFRVPAAILILYALNLGIRTCPPDASLGRSGLPRPARSKHAALASRDVPSDVTEQLRQSIARREYKPSQQTRDASGRSMDPRLHFVNRAQGMRAYFDARGVEVLCRVPQTEPSRMRFHTLGWGRVPSTVSSPFPVMNGSEIQYQRKGGTESYANTPAGIEQIYHLHARPPGDGPLTIRIAVEGDFSETQANDDCVEFRLRDLTRLTYSHLAVADASQRPMPARLAYASGEITIHVDDRSATYPIHVDPLILNQGWSVQGNQGGATATLEPRLGASVASAGDVNGDGYADIVVTSPDFDDGQVDEGAVFVWYGSASGLSTSNTTGLGARKATNPDANWVMETEIPFGGYQISASGIGDVNGDGFGDLAIGVPTFNAGIGGQGAVFVYYGSVAGLPTAEGGGGMEGQVSPDASWATLAGPNTVSFGLSVAPAGDVNGDGFADLLVGAPNHYDSLGNAVGAVFVFYGSATGLPVTDTAGPSLAAQPVPDASWAAACTAPDSNFGWSVAGAGDVNGDGYADILVGASQFEDGSTPKEGAVYAYYGSPTGLPTATGAVGLVATSVPDASWAARSNNTQSNFGWVVSTAGDVNKDGYADILVGAPQFSSDPANLPSEGAVFVFYGSAAGLPLADAGIDLAGTPSPDAGWAARANVSGASLGISASTAGDVNGDGYADILVGANGLWAVFLYQGSAAGLSIADGGGGLSGTPIPDADWSVTLSSPTIGTLGDAVACAGDVNGDGYSDILLGASYGSFGQQHEGLVFAYFGSATGLPTTDTTGPSLAVQSVPDASWAAEGLESSPAQLGVTIARAGDVNGDGRDDLVVGAPTFDNGQYAEGAVFVFYGSSTGFSTSNAGNSGLLRVAPDPSWAVESNQVNFQLGIAVAGGGDVNKDGYADIAVSAVSSAGAVFVFHGSVSGLPIADSGGGLAGSLTPDASWAAELDLSLANSSPSEFFGKSIALLPNVTGDGYADLAVGTSWIYEIGAGTSYGAVFVYHGSAAGLPTTDGAGGLSGLPIPDATWAVRGPDGNFFGTTVASAGDVNGDGFTDLVVGEPSYQNTNPSEGAVFVYYGSASGLPTADAASGTAGWTSPDASWAARSTRTGASMGSVLASGDFNGDGYSDLVTVYFGLVVLVYYGSNSGLPTSDVPPNTGIKGRPSPDASWAAVGNGSFGAALAAGDLNKDGFTDLIVGAPTFSNGENEEGAVYVYLGSAAGLSTAESSSTGLNDPNPDPQLAAESNLPFAHLGSSLAVLDPGGFPFRQVAAGAPGYSNGEGGEGAVFLFFGDFSPPVAGTVNDGLGADIDIQISTTTISASWTGFSDPETGIAGYEWALGTTPGGTDVQAFTSVGLATNATSSSLTLTSGQIYYVTIRATNGQGLQTIVTSDGSTVDTSPPITGAVNDGPAADLGFSASLTTLSANWSGFSDPQSGITGYEWAIGTTPGGTGIQAFSPVGLATSATTSSLTLVHGQSYYITVRATNGVGLTSTATSNGISIDTTPPTPGLVSDGAATDIDFQSSLTTLSANWSGFADAQSGIAGYEWAIGTLPGQSNVQGFTSVGLLTSATSSPLLLAANQTYYVTVRATNGTGLQVTAASDGVLVDTSAPTAGAVNDGLVGDVNFQSSLTTISANWSGFADAQSGITGYEWAIGTTSGGTDLQTFTSVGSASNATNSALPLTGGQIYYVSVRATNGAGLTGVATSNGVTVDTTLPTAGTVQDGPSFGPDLDTQSYTDRIAAHWSGFADAQSGIAAYEWAIGITPGGTEVQDFVSVGTATSAVASGLFLLDGQTYYATVRAANSAGLQITATSNGVTVSAPAPTTVINQTTKKSCGLLGFDGVLLAGLCLLVTRRLRHRAT